MHGRVVEALGVFVRVREEFEQLTDEARGGCADGGDARGDLVGRERLVGRVEADHRERPGLVEDDVGRLGVDDDVELGHGAPVADVHSAAHEYDLLDALREARLFAHGEGDVGEGASGHERDRLRRVAHDDVDDEVDGVPRVEFDGGLGQHGPVEARLTVDVGRRLDAAYERPVRSASDGHGIHANDARDGERIARDLLDRLVAHDGRDGEQVDRGGAMREQHRNRVIVAGVAVENDLVRAGICGGVRHALSLLQNCIYERDLRMCRVRS